MNRFTAVDLEHTSSIALLHTLANHIAPVHLVFEAELCEKGGPESVLTVWIDGCDSAHQLVLNSDGTWNMRTTLEV